MQENGVWWFLSSVLVFIGNSQFLALLKRVGEGEQEVKRERQLRLTEREGRIRLQQGKRLQRGATNESAGFTYKAIGVVESVFLDRRGTPRQPILVTASRGRIKMFLHEDFFKELAEFSHVWVLFDFHDNTNQSSSSGDDRPPVAKIKPPRLAGRRVGCLSTRSPHRPNPIGLSVCRIEAVTSTSIEISGLDMVHGTPVLDIKPYIPYDILPFGDTLDLNHNSTSRLSTLPMLDLAHSLGSDTSITPLSVPSWVCESDIPLRPVAFAPSAMLSLQQIFSLPSSTTSSSSSLPQRSRSEPIFFSKSATEAQRLIEQVLAQDIRGTHQGRGAALEAQVYECQLDHLHITFVTQETHIFVTAIRSNAYTSLR